MLDNSSLFLLNSLIYFTLYSAFIYHAWQKFIVTLTLTNWLIRIISRVKLQQWKESVFKLKCRLNRGRIFNWRRKHKLSRFLKRQCKDRRDTEQKRFIASLFTLSQKEFENFSIYWDQRLIQNIFLWMLNICLFFNYSAEFNCSKNRFSALTLSEFTVRCIRIIVTYCNLKLQLDDVYMRLKFYLKRNFYVSFKRNCRHLQHSFLTIMCRNSNIFIFSVIFCSIITLIIILRKVWLRWTVITVTVLCIWQRLFIST